MMPIKYLKIKNQTETSADLYIYGDIVGSEWDKWDSTDVAPGDVRDFLDQLKNVEEMNIYINSGGGSVFAGLAIYNMLMRNSAKKTVYVDGLAASIASVIALCGDTVKIPSNAFMMIHRPWTIAWGNAGDMRKAADDLDKIKVGMMKVYEDNLAEGAKIEEIEALVDAESWLTGEEAANYFSNVEVVEANRMVACSSELFGRYKDLPKEVMQPPAAKVANAQKLKMQNELDLLLL